MRKVKSLHQVLASSAWWQWVLVGLVCISPAVSQAAPYNLTWTGTVQLGSDPVPPGVSNGDPFNFTFTVDNGGTSSLLQTWTTSNFVKATINVHNGAYIGTKLTIDLPSSSGVFQTDALGHVSVVPSSWQDFFTGQPFSDSLGNNQTNSGLGGYFINGNNEVWAINTPATPAGVSQIEISAGDVATNQLASRWSVSAVPEPSTLVLAILGVLGVCHRKRMR